MLEYEFEEVPADRGVFVGVTKDHREMILRRAGEGWRHSGWIPAQQMNGNVTLIDLIFEGETEGKA